MERSRSYRLDDPRHREAEIARLLQQARVSFSLEREALVEHGLAGRKSLLDLGCGQASFLSLIAADFFGLRCAGADRNPGLLEVARRQPGVSEAVPCDIASPASLGSVLQRIKPDTVLCRFVLQHMSAPERQVLLRTLAQHGGLRVILADVDSDAGFFEPASPLLAQASRNLVKLQARLGGDRRVGQKLGALLSEAGFREVKTTRTKVDSAKVGFGPWWKAFGSVITTGLLGQPTVREAVLEWGNDAATAAHWRGSFDVCYASGTV
jgi:hypothetical protein